ncbi:MAG: polysaccharide deacetylase family protein [Xanthobacteraceae bacterium]
MAGFRQKIIRGGLEGLYFSGAHVALKPFVAGVGAILTLHHVRPPRPDRFQPNRLLEITPRFLTRVVRYILKDADVPFAVYVPTSFPDRIGELWWLALEAVIARNNHIGMQIAGRNRTFDCETVAAKRALYEEIYWWLRSLPSEEELRSVIHNLAACYHVDIAAFCSELCMGWPELAELAADPLVTIGAHTVNHPMLAKLPQKAVRSEMDLSRSIIEAGLGIRPAHLSYPVGDRTSAGPREFEIAAELGFKTAVTTRPGVLFAEHSNHLTALPRISLNGEYQRLRYVRVLLSGSATAMWSGFRRLDAA